MMIVFFNYDYDDVDRYYLCLHTDSDSDIGNDDGYDEDERSDNDGGDKNDFVDNYDEDGFYDDFKDEDNFEDNDDEDGFGDVNFLQKFPPRDLTCVSQVLTFLLLSWPLSFFYDLFYDDDDDGDDDTGNDEDGDDGIAVRSLKDPWSRKKRYFWYAHRPHQPLKISILDARGFRVNHIFTYASSSGRSQQRPNPTQTEGSCEID